MLGNKDNRENIVHGSCESVGGVLFFGKLLGISLDSLMLFFRLEYEPNDTSVEAMASPAKNNNSGV